MDEYEAKWITEEVQGRPTDWPCMNLREKKVDLVWNSVRIYYNCPSPVYRDIMLRNAFCYKREDLPSLGKYRISEYELNLLVRIYHAGCCFNSSSLRLFAYHTIMEWIDDDRYYNAWNKSQPISKMVVTVSRKRAEYLPLQLQLFYRVYDAMSDDWAQRRFAVLLNKYCREKIKSAQTEKELFNVEHAIVSLLYDISGNESSERDEKIAISKEELWTLLELEAEIFKRRKQSIMEHPLRGTLMIQLSNFILRMRRKQCADFVYKYISTQDLEIAYDNKQLWLGDIRDLNDKFEGCIAKELMNDLKEELPKWVDDVTFEYDKKFYVACYSKKADSTALGDRYGNCKLGYYGDRLVDYLGPVYWHKEEWKTNEGVIVEAYPTLSQVVALDVIYDKEEAKEELRYLVKCIETIGNSPKEKKNFLGEILQYWKLSFKDAVSRDGLNVNWSAECERRYVIFYYDGYDYRGSVIDVKDRRLKFETTVICAPDFVLGDVNTDMKNKIASELSIRYESVSVPDYYVCNNCLARGVLAHSYQGKCLVCGSRDIIGYKSKMFRVEED